MDTWHALPVVLEWLLKTIINGYTIQFACRPPRFSGMIMSDMDLTVLQAEICSLLSKQAIEEVPAETAWRDLLVPKKDIGSSSYSGFEIADPCTCKVLIQNDYCTTDPCTHSFPGLFYISGFKGCIFSRPKKQNSTAEYTNLESSHLVWRWLQER